MLYACSSLKAIFEKKKLCPFTEEIKQAIEWPEINHVTRVTCPTFLVGHVSLNLKLLNNLMKILNLNFVSIIILKYQIN